MTSDRFGAVRCCSTDGGGNTTDGGSGTDGESDGDEEQDGELSVRRPDLLTGAVSGGDGEDERE